MKDLYSVLREGSCATQRIIVGFSGGKDSVAMLDLCKEYFKDVYAFNMYFVDKMQLQEGYFRYIEDKYQIKILRLPHFELSRIYQTQDSMHRSFELDKVPTIYFSDVENYVRDFFKCKWIAYGMMACESIERNAMLKNNNGCDYEYAKLYPLAFWNNQKVYAYLKTKNIHLPPEYYISGRSANNPFVDLTQILLKTYYPSDWERVMYKFPLAETVFAKQAYQYQRWVNNGKPERKKGKRKQAGTDEVSDFHADAGQAE